MWKGEWKAYAAWLALPVFGIVGALIAVSLFATKAAQVTADPWYAPAPVGRALPAASRVPPKQVMEVQPSQLAEAELLLATFPSTELTAQDVERLTGHPEPVVLGRRPYLVRALAHDGSNCSFQILAEGNVVEVAHGCLASSTSPLRHRALVLMLEQLPSALYVTASVAE